MKICILKQANQNKKWYLIPVLIALIFTGDHPGKQEPNGNYPSYSVPTGSGNQSKIDSGLGKNKGDSIPKLDANEEKTKVNGQEKQQHDRLEPKEEILIFQFLGLKLEVKNPGKFSVIIVSSVLVFILLLHLIKRKRRNYRRKKAE